MITLSQKLNLIEACFGTYHVSGDGKNSSIVCPFCKAKGKATSKKKLSINIETGVYHCWVCESKGRNIGSAAFKFSSNRVNAKKLSEAYGGFKKAVEEIIEEHVLLPEDFKLLTNLNNRGSKKYKYHISYLKDRGLTTEDLHKFCIGVSDTYEYKNSVIFPSHDVAGNLNYFISRSINKKSYRRYKNCSVSRKEIIFRQFNLDFKKELILVEGVFDLINAPINSTCILGSWLNEDYLLFREIVKNKTPVVLCLDPDARKKSMKIMKLLNSYCVPARLSLHNNKDFGDMSKDEIQYFINNAKPFDFAQSVRYLISNINSGSMF